MRRGAEYAEQLTDAERRVLDTLLAELASRPAPAARRSWRAPVAVGVVSLVVLLAAASVPLLRATTPSPPADEVAVPSAVEVLSELATAAAGVPDPWAPAEQWYRHWLDVRVSMVGDTPGSCRVTAVTIELWEGADTDKFHLLTGRLVAGGRIDPPAGAAALAGCTAPSPDPPSPLWEGPSERPADDWSEMVEELGWSEIVDHGEDQWILEWPAYTDPRWPALRVAGVASVDRVDEVLREFARIQPVPSGSEPSLWWTMLVNVLTSPVSDAAPRAAALRAAAAREEAVLVPELTADVTGRPGVTLRVPYFYFTTLEAGTADLTFDVDTGALLQRVVNIDAGVDVTVYLAMERL